MISAKKLFLAKIILHPEKEHTENRNVYKFSH